MDENLENQLNSYIMEKADAERDFIRESARLEFFETLDEIPEQYIEQRNRTQMLADFFQKRVDFYNLKIEELNAIISNTQ